jgi:hypothetical protein
LAQKLVYEWKNIYRTLSTTVKDSDQGVAKLGEFQKVCHKSGIEFDKKDLMRLAQNFSHQNN